MSGSHRPSPAELDRVRKRVERCISEVLAGRRIRAQVPMLAEAAHLHGEPLPPSRIDHLEFGPFPIGRAWGGRWDTTWFRLRADLPPHWPREPVRSRISLGYHGAPGFGAEGLVYQGGCALQGISSRREEVLLPPFFGPNRSVELLVEAAANPPVDRPMWEWDELGVDFHGRPLFRLDRADLILIDPEVDQLSVEMATLGDLLAVLGPEHESTPALFQAINGALDELDPALPNPVGARASLAEYLTRPSHRHHRVVAVGHAHIDTAWLWPMRETRRKVARTIANVLALADRYPELRFTWSSACQHQWLAEDHPELFKRAQSAIAAGVIEPVGNMWVEMDANMPSGEALVRQLLHGTRFFDSHYGLRSSVAWLPDGFGFPASLPQILIKAGLTSFCTQKLCWNETNRFPYPTFWWEGIDGTRILSHFPTADTYNGQVTPTEIIRSASAPLSLYPFGFGDGGGGPTEQMLQATRLLESLEGCPNLSIGRAGDFFESLSSDTDTGGLPVFYGDLYLETHRGTFTTQLTTKVSNRRSEAALREAEIWATLMPSGPYPSAEFDRLWEVLLRNQFHDVLPGSAIRRVNEEAQAELTGLIRAADLLTTSTLNREGDLVAVYNCATHSRQEVIELPVQRSSKEIRSVMDSDGRRWPIQISASQHWLASVTVPGLGVATLRPSNLPPNEPVAAAGAREVAEGMVLFNDMLEVRFDYSGAIDSIFFLPTRREVLCQPGKANQAQLFRDEPLSYDAWNIESDDLERPIPIAQPSEFELVEHGPLRSTIRITTRVGASSMLTQWVSLCTGSAMILIDNELDWHERHRLLKLAFPVAVNTRRAAYAVAFGHTYKATHTNTSVEQAQFENCAHAFVDCSEPGFGVALLNSGRYGHDIKSCPGGNVIRVSLARAPRAPDPLADQGIHRVSLALWPHEGDLAAADVPAAGEAFNQPLRLARTDQAGGSYLRVDSPAILVSALKKAENGSDLILRCYESHGSQVTTTIAIGLPIQRAERVNLLEESVTPDYLEVIQKNGHTEIPICLRPFEILTIRLVPGVGQIRPGTV
jgi:alpha-mannosidase